MSLCMPALPKDWDGEFCLPPSHLVTPFLSLQFQPHTSLLLYLLEVPKFVLFKFVKAGAIPARLSHPGLLP